MHVPSLRGQRESNASTLGFRRYRCSARYLIVPPPPPDAQSLTPDDDDTGCDVIKTVL